MAGYIGPLEFVQVLGDYVGDITATLPRRFIGAAVASAGASAFRRYNATSGKGLSTARRFTGGRRTRSKYHARPRRTYRKASYRKRPVYRRRRPTRRYRR